jgi:hypothetical protein
LPGIEGVPILPKDGFPGTSTFSAFLLTLLLGWHENVRNENKKQRNVNLAMFIKGFIFGQN